ncbi:MAG TPA: hypothetical protein PLY66_06690 [Acidobacteriota bacterium]|nr:hypothetical protein [Acidobacteriota bacterium]HOT00676.1 hypothetical protein [Acidobacteriota bacterium]HQF86246.1 hypothetical protein [Acidobacteriota bacterium]HQG90511.1 hypothetical protein [Acidobacteriota bacterium]HQK87214.1 hypothetical protein [Acidobacteriota bacterium]
MRDHILNLDDENDPARNPEVARHLADCAECRELLEGVEKTWAVLSAHPGLDPSPGFNQAVWRKIEAAEARQPLRLLRLAFLPPPVRVVAWSGAAALLIAFSLLLLLPGDLSPAPVEFSANDQRDQQLLLEVDQLMDYDESRVMDVYEEWDMTNEVRPTEPEAADPVDGQDPADGMPGKALLSNPADSSLKA